MDDSKHLLVEVLEDIAAMGLYPGSPERTRDSLYITFTTTPFLRTHMLYLSITGYLSYMLNPGSDQMRPLLSFGGVGSSILLMQNFYVVFTIS